MYFGFYFFFVQKKGSVEQTFAIMVFVACGRAEDYRYIRSMLFYLINCLVTFIDKIIELQEIPRRVTANGKL